MSFLDKLKFWKHEEEPLDREFGELESAFPTGGGPMFPTGLAEEKPMESFGQLSPMNQTAQGPGSMNPMTVTPAGTPYQLVQPQTMYQPVQPPLNKDLEIISLKLDTIKNILDTINMRLERLEQQKHPEEYPLRQGKF